MEINPRHAFHAAADDAVLDKEPENFEQGPVVPTSSDQVFVRDAINGMFFHVEGATNKLMIGTLTAQEEEVDNRLSDA